MTEPAKKAKKLNRGERTSADVAALLRARNACLWVVTREEVRVERALIEAAGKAKFATKFWDCATGITDGSGKDVDRSATDPANVLNTIRDSRKREVWVLRDLHPWLRDPSVLRQLRSLARSLPQADKEQARAVIVLTPSPEVPPELAGHTTVIDWPLPDRDEVSEILTGVVEAMPVGVEKPDNLVFDRAVDAAVGLLASEAESCYAKSIVTSRAIDPVVISAEKRRVITREKVLEWFDPVAGGLDAIGGLEALKDWLIRRKVALTQKARDFGIPAPKGCLLIGPPGCGKSLTAKAVATAWGVPLLRLDMGALKSKWVGESESNLRRALAVAEAVAPAVLWLDEIEKALAGAIAGGADGGVSADALGTVLSWMQEHQGSVFVVATSNDVTKLPPELLRKGRFDELFWVDLPTASEREAVVEASLRGHGRAEHPAVDAAEVARACDEFTGAEIAALVPEALFTAFADGEREVTTADLLEAAKTVVPLAKTAGDKIDALRNWAKTRARPASKKPAFEVEDVSRAGGLDIGGET